MKIELPDEALAAVLPEQATAQSLAALIQNALDANLDQRPIVITGTGTESELRISIRDQGHGMPDNVLRRIAEPFFTTKEPGKGMGLGTFLVRTFAERLGGRVLFDSVPGEGTTVTLELPLQSHGRTLMPQSEDIPLALVVDDDEVFRNRLCRAFAQRNWEAEAVPDGEKALKFARDRSPDLVLVDLRMPGKGGLDVVQELRAIDSSMTIIVLTGYGSIPTAISAMKRGADHYLSKPADADQILAAYESLRTAPKEIPDVRKLFPAWPESNGSTCSASFPIAAETYRKLPVCWAFIGALYSES